MPDKYIVPIERPLIFETKCGEFGYLELPEQGLSYFGTKPGEPVRISVNGDMLELTFRHLYGGAEFDAPEAVLCKIDSLCRIIIPREFLRYLSIGWGDDLYLYYWQARLRVAKREPIVPDPHCRCCLRSGTLVEVAGSPMCPVCLVHEIATMTAYPATTEGRELSAQSVELLVELARQGIGCLEKVKAYKGQARQLSEDLDALTRKRTAPTADV